MRACRTECAQALTLPDHGSALQCDWASSLALGIYPRAANAYHCDTSSTPIVYPHGIERGRRVATACERVWNRDPFVCLIFM